MSLAVDKKVEARSPTCVGIWAFTFRPMGRDGKGVPEGAGVLKRCFVISHSDAGPVSKGCSFDSQRRRGLVWPGDMYKLLCVGERLDIDRTPRRRLQRRSGCDVPRMAMASFALEYIVQVGLAMTDESTKADEIRGWT